MIKDTTQLINDQELVKRKGMNGLRTCELTNPSQIANAIWQGWERKEKEKPFSWPMQNHVNFVNKYPALLKWGLLIKERKELGHLLLKLQLDVCVKGLVKTKESMSLSVSLSCLSFRPEILSLRMSQNSELKDWMKRFRSKVQATSTQWRPLKGSEPWTSGMGLRPTETCALMMLKLQTSRSAF